MSTLFDLLLDTLAYAVTVVMVLWPLISPLGLIFVLTAFSPFHKHPQPDPAADREDNWYSNSNSNT